MPLELVLLPTAETGCGFAPPPSPHHHHAQTLLKQMKVSPASVLTLYPLVRDLHQSNSICLRVPLPLVDDRPLPPVAEEVDCDLDLRVVLQKKKTELNSTAIQAWSEKNASSFMHSNIHSALQSTLANSSKECHEIIEIYYSRNSIRLHCDEVWLMAYTHLYNHVRQSLLQFAKAWHPVSK